MLTELEISEMRDQCAAAMPDTFERFTRSLSSTSSGGLVQEFESAGMCPCRLAWPRKSNSTDKVSAFETASARLVFPVDFELLAQDEVEVGGVRYQVTFVEEASTWMLSRSAALQRLGETQ